MLLTLTNVQVTISPAATWMFEGTDPLEHVTSAAGQPPGVVCEIEYPPPGSRLAKTCVFDNGVAVVAVVIELERGWAEAAARREGEVLRIVEQSVLHDDYPARLYW